MASDPEANMTLLASSPIWLATAVVIALLLTYRALLPRPISGIPYNQKSANRLLGDIPDLVAHTAKTAAPTTWFLNEHRKHAVAMFQVFTNPFGKPMVLLSDHREMQDILMRRTKEFDRADFVCDLLSGPAGQFQTALKTTPLHKSHRLLVQDLMTPSFLHKTAAPQIYSSVERIVSLWAIKARLAAGRPFTADHDLNYAALDSVLAFSFGDSYPHKGLIPQLELMSRLAQEPERFRDAQNIDEPVDFPRAPLHHTLQATIARADSVSQMFQSIKPRWSWWWMSRFTGMRENVRTDEAYHVQEIAKAVDRANSAEGENQVRNAVDFVVNREKRIAQKEGREPRFFSRMMIDEVRGFVVAGHDTTSTTLAWGLKYLQAAPAVQQRLRDALRQAHPQALSECRPPSFHEILKNQVPYLEATVEEMLRCAAPIPMIVRQAQRSTTVLGVHLPKGTQVLLHGRGPSITSPRVEIPEHIRSSTSQMAKDNSRYWDDQDVDKFKPERWLSVNATGEEIFNPNAGPQLAFSLGPRGCWGRRLGLMTLKFIVTMLIWHFQFLSTPVELSGSEIHDVVTAKPRQVFVRIQTV